MLDLSALKDFLMTPYSPEDSVHYLFRNTVPVFETFPEDKTGRIIGTGVFLPGGWMISAYHVVEKCFDKLENDLIVAPGLDGQYHTLEYWAHDDEKDLVVFYSGYLPEGGFNFTNPEPGDKVTALSCDLEKQLTSGTVLSTDYTILFQDMEIPCIAIDAETYKGGSGGVMIINSGYGAMVQFVDKGHENIGPARGVSGYYVQKFLIDFINGVARALQE